MPEGCCCSFELGDEVVNTSVSLRVELNNTVLDLIAPFHVPRAFLAVSLPWEGVGISDVRPINLSILKDLQTALANEASFHLDGTALKQKTRAAKLN